MIISSGSQILRSRLLGSQLIRTLPRFSSNIPRDDIDTYRKTTSLDEFLNVYKDQFPKDQATISAINNFQLLSRRRNEIQNIKIGIMYDNEEIRSNSKVLESLLSDPLAEGNKLWFDEISSRNKSELNKFIYESQENGIKEEENSAFHIYKVKSPILSSIYRSSYTETLDGTKPNVSNEIEIIELNNIEEVNDLDFIINVTNSLSATLSNQSKPKSIQNKTLLTIVDNPEYSPSSIESSPVTFDIHNFENHIIKVNSQLANSGTVDFLKYDTKVSDEFIDSIKNSNIYELCKAIGWYLRTDNLTRWTLSTIKHNLLTSASSVQSLSSLYKEIKNDDIKNFIESVHSELQYDFIPKTDKFFRKSLSWWKLYLRNDNIEYDLKDYFSKNFMTKSIENFNYSKGLIVNKITNGDMNEESTSPSTLQNPLMNLKNEIINEKVSTEIQPHIYKIIGTALINYQLPISILSFLSYQYFDFSLNSAIALSLLGWIVGFNYVSKKWESISRNWLTNLYETIRLSLNRDCIENGLLKEANLKFEEELKFVTLKTEILKGINEFKI